MRGIKMAREDEAELQAALAPDVIDGGWQTSHSWQRVCRILLARIRELEDKVDDLEEYVASRRGGPQ